MISRVRNTRSYMPREYQDGASGSHRFGTPDRTCLEGIRSGLQDLTGSEHHNVHALRVSGWCCRISRVRNTRSYMPRGYQVGVSGSHGFGTPDRTGLEGIRMEL